MPGSFQERLRDHFKWSPGCAHTSAEAVGLACPAFWLTYEDVADDPYESGLYFVNDLGVVLPKVVVGTGGWIAGDGEMAPISAPVLVYEDVQPGEGVFVDAHHIINDSDTVFIEHIEVTLADGRTLSFEASGKGNVEVRRPLMWRLPPAE